MKTKFCRKASWTEGKEDGESRMINVDKEGVNVLSNQERRSDRQLHTWRKSRSRKKIF